MSTENGFVIPIIPDISFENILKVVQKLREGIEKGLSDIDLAKMFSTVGDNFGAVKKGAVEKFKEDLEKNPEKAINDIKRGVDEISNVGVSFIKKTFSFVESIFNQLKKSSPLLQAVEQLFQLAWTLFFMPLGNKLGEMLIPAVIQLVDDVAGLWDAFEGMSLGEAFTYAISKGVEMLAGFFEDIGSALQQEGGFLGSIGTLMMAISNFLQKDGANLINVLIGVATWILEHIKELIAVVVAFKVASLGLQLTQTLLLAMPQLAKEAGAGLAIIAGLSIGAGAYTYGALNGSTINTYASGGYVPATSGGQLAILGEGGEGEYVIPESKINNLRGGNTYNITFTGYNDDQLVDKVKEITSGQISQARLRSGF